MLNELDDLCTTQSVFSNLKISERSISAENRSTIAQLFCSCSQNSNQVAESDFTSLLAEAEASEKAAQSSYDKLAEQNTVARAVLMTRWGREGHEVVDGFKNGFPESFRYEFLHTLNLRKLRKSCLQILQRCRQFLREFV